MWGDDLVETGIHEPRKLDLGNGFESHRGHADGGTDDPRLCKRGVDDAVAAELVEQALGRAEDAAVLPHILAQHEDVVVLAHLGVQSVSNRLYHGKVLCLAHSLLQECFVAVCLAERRELLVLPL